MTDDKKYEVAHNEIWTVDFETDNKNDENLAFSASPFYPGNGIVAGSWRIARVDTGGNVEETDHCYYHTKVAIQSTEDINRNIDEGPVPWLLTGHNVRFDLAYIRPIWEEHGSGTALCNALKNGDTKLWDTEFAEYLLTGQHERMRSLDYLARKYEVGEKDLEVTDFWKEGYQTDAIDPDTLVNYVKNDTYITQQVALRQIALAQKHALLPFILNQMRSLFVVHEYEYNGMYIDETVLTTVSNAHEVAQKTAKVAYENEFSSATGVDIENVDINSTTQLKAALFGGEYTHEKRVQKGYYKSGQRKGEPKYGKEKNLQEFPNHPLDTRGILDEHLTPTGKMKRKTGSRVEPKHVSLDKDAIEDIKTILRDVKQPGYLRALEAYSAYKLSEKMVSTYCYNLRNYRFQHNGLIHCNYNVDVTPTGRLSCSNPNLQNQPSLSLADIKSAFTSRFEEGSMATIDFKQLELVCLAYRSGDRQLIDDIMNGVDVHTQVGRDAGIQVGVPDTRKEVKRVVFGSIYGAGVSKLCQQSTLSTEAIKRIKKMLSERYPEAFMHFVDKIDEELTAVCTQLDERAETGHLRYESLLIQPSGRAMRFETEPDKYKGSMEAWPYTYKKNWPIQSLAADIVSVARVLFFDVIRELSAEDDVKMVNEVHDEIVFDLGPGQLEKFHDVCIIVSDRLPAEIGRQFGLPGEFPLPLKIEVGYGDSWKDCK